ncbi:MAG: hypothetical protein ACKOAD_02850 [Gammaproteobacteria bacterium]
MQFLENFSKNLDAIHLFGLVILISLIGAEIFSRFKMIPRVSAYIMSGFVFGPNFLNWITEKSLFEMSILRILSKFFSVWIFKSKSDLTKRQAISIVQTIIPMTGLAIGIMNRVLDYNADIGNQLMSIVSTSIAFFGIFGPILTQWALVKSDEHNKNL